MLRPPCMTRATLVPIGTRERFVDPEMRLMAVSDEDVHPVSSNPPSRSGVQYRMSSPSLGELRDTRELRPQPGPEGGAAAERRTIQRPVTAGAAVGCPSCLLRAAAPQAAPRRFGKRGRPPNWLPAVRAGSGAARELYPGHLDSARSMPRVSSASEWCSKPSIGAIAMTAFEVASSTGWRSWPFQSRKDPRTPL